MLRSQKNNTNQQGFVSIIVTLILMIVLSLIVLGFARLSRREQRNTLDRQLSTQAFYAAESGINDFSKALSNGTIDLSIPSNHSRTTCGGPWPVNNVLDSTTNTEYTCVLYNLDPPNLVYDAKNNQVTIIPITNTNLRQLKFSWGSGPGDTNFRPSPITDLPPAGSGAGNWNSDAGILKAVLIPRKDINRNQYLNNTFTGYMYPLQTAGSAGSVNYNQGFGANNSGVIGDGHCDQNNTSTAYKCNIDLNLDPLVATFGAKGWYLVLTSIYVTPQHVQITCNDGVTDVPCEGAQMVIDATGKSQDVIRRVQVRKTLTNGTSDFLPIGFESANSICKQIQVAPPDLNDIGNTGDPTDSQYCPGLPF